MIVKQVEVTRQCKYCQKTRQDIEPFLYLSINHAAGIIQRASKECANCKSRDMTIVRVNLKILSNWVYGNPNTGHWKCPSHPKMYYPEAIKRAAGQGYRNGYNSEYTKIAQTGFPWRCPICNEEMYYFDDREHEIWV